MNTNYDNWQITSLNTEVIKCEKEKEGKYWLLLKDTIFYPGGGAQEKDEGTINGLKVLDFKIIDKQIYHCVNEKIKGKARCVVDEKIRERHSQIHTGQHLLCSIINKKYKGKTITHFNNQNEAIAELALNTCDDKLIEDVENLCNKYIKEGLAVNFLYPNKEEAFKHVNIENLSEENISHDDLRAVVIGDIDYNLCGCIHVNNLRYLQALKIIRYEKTTRGYRLYFVVGQLLREWMNKQLIISKQITKLLSTPIDNCLEAINNLLLEKKKDKQDIISLQEKYNAYLISDLQNKKEDIIVSELTNIDNKQLAKIGLTLLKTKQLVFLLSEEDNVTRFYFGKEKNNDFDLTKFFKQVKDNYEVKGGGNPLFVQGSINGKINDITEFIKNNINKN